MLQLVTKHGALQNKHGNVFRHKIYLDSDMRCLEAKIFQKYFRAFCKNHCQ